LNAALIAAMLKASGGFAGCRIPAGFRETEKAFILVTLVRFWFVPIISEV